MWWSLAFLGIMVGCDAPDEGGIDCSACVSGSPYSDLWSDRWPEVRLLAVDTLLRPGADVPPIGALNHASLSPSGSLAVSDSLTGEVWVKKARRPWTRAVMEGDGPREVRFVGGLWWTGDTLHVFDAVRSRVMSLTGGLEPIGDGWALPIPDGVAERRLVLGSRDAVVIRTSGVIGPETEEGVYRSEMTLQLIRRTGAVEVLGSWPGRSWMRTPGGYGPQPFGARTHVHGRGRYVFVADGAERWVRGLPVDGGTEIEWAWTDPRPVLSDSLRALWQEAALSSVPPPQRSLAARMMQDIPLPDSLPSIGGLLGGEEGVWVARWYPTSVERLGTGVPASEWRILPLDGERSVGSIAIRAGAQPVALLPGRRVLLRIEDEWGRRGVAVARWGPAS